MKRKNVDARAQIIHAAGTLFARRGYHRTSLGEILDAAQVSRSNLYYHFRSKDALLHEVLALWIEEAGRELLPSMEDPSLSAPERIRALIRALARRIERIGVECGCPVLNLTVECFSPGAPRVPELDRFFSGLQAAIEDCLRKGIRSGKLRADLDPRRSAHLVMATLQGAAMMARRMGTTRPVEECAKELFDQLSYCPAPACRRHSRPQASSQKHAPQS